MYREDHPKLVSYDPGRDEDPDKLLEKELELSLERFTSDRHKLVDRLNSLAEKQWRRTADHEEYRRKFPSVP